MSTTYTIIATLEYYFRLHSNCVLFCILDIGWINLPSEIQLETPILQVVESNAHKDFARQGIMVKGTVVKIEAKAFNDW